MIRTHIGRPLDLSYQSNRMIAALVLISALAAVAIMITGGSPDVWVAPLHAFLMWALVREIDPDHGWAALAAAFGAAMWVISGQEPLSALAIGGLMLAARLVVNSTGRRPLPTDLAVAAAGAAAISYTTEGFVAGFGIGVAIYIDDRLAEEQRTISPVAAASAAFASVVVASLLGALPDTVPDFVPVLAVAIGALALVTVVREPAEPTSVTDMRARRQIDLEGQEIVARFATEIERHRLHAARSLIAVLLFVTVVLAGSAAWAAVPVVAAFALTTLTTDPAVPLPGRS